MKIKIVLKRGHMKILKMIFGVIQFVMLVGASVLLLIMFLLLGHPS